MLLNGDKQPNTIAGHSTKQLGGKAVKAHTIKKGNYKLRPLGQIYHDTGYSVSMPLLEI
jgi:hypothetical protein